MAIVVYNTLTRKKEEFQPIHEGLVNFYLCGPTVYNYIHIGNARSSVAFDTIRRYLEYRGYQVNYVSNFTDVDDKIIKAAITEKSSPQAISDKYIEAFKEDTAAINVMPASMHPRVMENIPEIIDFIQVLLAKGSAYESAGDVYFRTSSFPNYGALSRKTLEELQVGASERIDEATNLKKESPLDFALWKSNTNRDEISWPSPWGQGRPGWHIECSVMSTKYLGTRLDIHAGGQDLEFPHHENEIAQSESHSGQQFAKYWLHNGFVTMGSEGEKMSKSLGNYVLLRDLLKEMDPMVIRFLLASVHYRRPIKFDEDAIEEAQNNLKRLEETFYRLNYRIEETQATANIDSSLALAKLESDEAAFIQAMDDDFNVANGLTIIYEMVKHINQYLDQTEVNQDLLINYRSKLTELLAIYGIEFKQAESLDERVSQLIKERNEARQSKNFQRADEIRDLLGREGIVLDDTPQGTLWKRVK